MIKYHTVGYVSPEDTLTNDHVLCSGCLMQLLVSSTVSFLNWCTHITLVMLISPQSEQYQYGCTVVLKCWNFPLFEKHVHK